MARLSVVIVSFNSAATLPACLQALRDHGPMPPHDIVVVDNASQDGTAAMLARDWPSVTLLRQDANLGFAAANNRGIRATQRRPAAAPEPRCRGHARTPSSA